GFDSNVLYGPPGTEEAAFRLRVTPSLSLSTLGSARAAGSGPTTAPPVANFRAQIAAIVTGFFPASGPGLPADFHQVDVGAQAGFRLDLFPRSTWQFSLYDDFTRTVQGGPDFGVSLYLYQTIRNSGGFDIVYAPNGGIIDLRLSYVNRTSIFENAQVGYLSNM